MSESVGRIDLDLGVNYGQFKKEIGGIAGSAQALATGAFKKLGLVIGTAFAVRELVTFGKQSLSLASDLTEVQNVVDVTFGSMSADVNKFAKSALYSYGLSELAAKKYISTMGAMLKSSGITGSKLLEMSTSLTALAGDISSFYNLSADEAFFKLQSGISGEIEPLRRLGINLTQANIEAWALSKGMKVSMQSMDFASQALLRYNYIMEVTKDAQGDFVRTQGSWANQTRLLAMQWNIFKSTMGQAFINVLTPVLQGLNWLIQKMQLAAQYFKAFTELIFGAQQTAAGAGAATVDMTDAVGGVGDASKKAGKDIKGSLASFDEIHSLAENTAESMNDAAAGAAGVDLVKAATGQIDIGVDTSGMDIFKQKLMLIQYDLQQIVQYLQANFGPAIYRAFNGMAPVLDSWKLSLASAFIDIAELGVPLKNWFTNDLIPFLNLQITVISSIFTGLLDSGLMVFNGVKSAVMPILEWFANDGLSLMTNFGTGMTLIFQEFWNYTKLVFDTLWEGAINPGLQLASSIILSVLTSIQTFWMNWGTKIVANTLLYINNIKNLFLQFWVAFLQPIVNIMLTTLTNLWNEHFKGVVTALLDFLGKLINGALEIYNKFIVPVMSYLIDKFGPTWVKAFKDVVTIISGALALIADVAKGIIRALGGIIEFIVGIFTGDWKRAWNGVKEVFAGIFDGVKAIFRTAVNFIIAGVNKLIEALNELQIDLPDWVPGVGGRSLGFHFNKIPLLANGGLVSAPTLAMVGDNKGANVDPEVVSPLSKLQDMIATAVMTAMQAQGSFGASNKASGDLIIQLDGVTLARVLRPFLNNEDGRIGTTIITQRI